MKTTVNSRPIHYRSVAWIAPDYPDGERLQSIIEQTFGHQSKAETFSERVSLPGFAIKSETIHDGITVTANQFVAVDEAEPPDSTFAIPAGYLTSIAK